MHSVIERLHCGLSLISIKSCQIITWPREPENCCGPSTQRRSYKKNSTHTSGVSKHGPVYKLLFHFWTETELVSVYCRFQQMSNQTLNKQSSHEGIYFFSFMVLFGTWQLLVRYYMLSQYGKDQPWNNLQYSYGFWITWLNYLLVNYNFK